MVLKYSVQTGLFLYYTAILFFLILGLKQFSEVFYCSISETTVSWKRLIFINTRAVESTLFCEKYLSRQLHICLWMLEIHKTD